MGVHVQKWGSQVLQSGLYEPDPDDVLLLTDNKAPWWPYYGHRIDWVAEICFDLFYGRDYKAVLVDVKKVTNFRAHFLVNALDYQLEE